jgi:predicted helicase
MARKTGLFGGFAVTSRFGDAYCAMIRRPKPYEPALINQFLNELDRLRSISGTNRESVVREAFKDLLKNWAKQHDLVFIAEFDFETPAKERRQIDGALLHSLRVPLGYWEAKDEDDDLDKEIEKKKRRGYPQDNIIFEDSRTAVLIQNRQEVLRAPVDDTARLERLLELFFSYERPEIAQFRKAVEQFKADLPAVLGALREKIEEANKTNATFGAAEVKFLGHAKETINPAVTMADVHEMLIQHILTEEIFSKIFDDGEFHHQNNIAKELYALEEKFFTGTAKKQTLKQLEPYYAAIRTAATQIPSHAEKQTFLKVIYENFYKVYNQKAADRLGVIYTPNEIVRFMIESADWLCEKHFGKSLIDKGVEILDPAVGTGTFICELLEHFRGQRVKLAYKYKEELHANEVAILPYYVANLNIEATYAAITGQYAEFPNLCFVDTLDNVAGLETEANATTSYGDLFGALSEENVDRIKRQNKRKISVIIGNPPYNANQMNENDDNKNRTYPRIDERIKATYIKESTAQKTKLYDMYARFFRWASDRLNKDGIIAFVSSRSFVDARSFDGFRKCFSREFQFGYIIDLGGDIRTLSGKDGIFLNEDHTIFGLSAAVGIAISFLVKQHSQVEQACKIYYSHPCDIRATREAKFGFLSTHPIHQIEFESIRPDKRNNWINLTDNDFDSFLPVASKQKKASKPQGIEQAIFELFSLGVVTNRDEWVYADSASQVTAKVCFLLEKYASTLLKIGEDNQDLLQLDSSIKWTRLLKQQLLAKRVINFDRDCVTQAMYRPFIQRTLYFSKQLNEMQYVTPKIFGSRGNHRIPTIAITDPTAQKPFMVLAVDRLCDLHFVGAAAGTLCFPLSNQTSGTRLDNITDWALEQFRAQYESAQNPSPLAEGVPAPAGTDEGEDEGSDPSPGASRHPLPQALTKD